MSKDSKIKRSKDSKDVLELIVARAIIDSDFRKQVLSDKESVAKEYKLEGKDLRVFKRIDSDLLDSARETAAMIPVVHLRSSL